MIARDFAFLFLTRSLRMLAYGMLSVVLVLHLSAIGIDQRHVGLLLTLTLIGDTAVSLYLTTLADRFGRRRTLLAGAVLMLAAGVVFAFTGNFWALLIAATIGVISPSGNEVGPFLAVEQAALSQILTPQRRTHVFAWYNLCGSLATASGALLGGLICRQALKLRDAPADGYRAVILTYAAVGALLALLFPLLSRRIELDTPGAAKTAGLGPSRNRVLGLAALFSLDAFGGGFIVQSFMAWYFHARFGLSPVQLGTLFFIANTFSGLSGLVAARVAQSIGLINTMVFTHLPSNILLILVPLMPNAPLALTMLVLRFCISQMDVPTRQSFTMAVVRPEERSAAAGLTGVARTLGSAIAPGLAGLLYARPSLMGIPFIIAGGLKIIYDLALWVAFKRVGVDEK